MKLSNTDLTKRAENAEAVQLKQDEQINDYKELITKLESDLSGQTTISIYIIFIYYLGNVTGDGSALLSSVLQSDIIMDVYIILYLYLYRITDQIHHQWNKSLKNKETDSDKECSN